MSANIGMTLVAAGFVQYAGGVPSFTWQNGGFVDAIVDTAAGIATITLMHEVDPLEGFIACVASTAVADNNVCIDHTTDTTIIATGGTGGAAAADNDFWLMVYQRDLRG